MKQQKRFSFFEGVVRSLYFIRYCFKLLFAFLGPFFIIRADRLSNRLYIATSKASFQKARKKTYVFLGKVALRVRVLVFVVDVLCVLLYYLRSTFFLDVFKDVWIFKIFSRLACF